MVSPTMDIDWSRRVKALNRCLLFAALLLGVLAAAGVLSNIGAQAMRSSALPAAVLLGGGAWLLAAFLFSRWRKFQISSGMLVLLAVAAVAGAIYCLPDYTLALLPLAVLPTALALLLLNRAGALAAAVITAAALLAITGLAMPIAAPLVPSLPVSANELGISVALATVGLLALILMPLRDSNSAMLAQLEAGELARQQLAQERAAVEQARDSAMLALERQRRHMETLLDHLQDGVVTVADNGRIVRANRVARELWGDIAQADLTNSTLDQLSSALVGPSESTRFAEIVNLPADAQVQGESYTHVLHDRREQARYARLRGELLGLLADEMRNPLTSMVTALDLTLGQQNLPDDVDRVLIGARQRGQQLLDLVTTLLEINQIQQNPDALRCASTSLARVLEAGIAHMAPLAQRGAVTVTVEHAGDSTIAIDSERMQRAFMFLLEQSLRQSPPYSTVQIRTERQEGLAIVRLSDQGPGLTPQQRETFWSHGGSADERSAPALGLAYSKLVIEAHGGKVWVESNGGQGSLYAFALPAERPSLLREA